MNGFGGPGVGVASTAHNPETNYSHLEFFLKRGKSHGFDHRCTQLYRRRCQLSNSILSIRAAPRLDLREAFWEPYLPSPSVEHTTVTPPGTIVYAALLAPTQFPIHPSYSSRKHER